MISRNYLPPMRAGECSQSLTSKFFTTYTFLVNSRHLLTFIVSGIQSDLISQGTTMVWSCIAIALILSRCLDSPMAQSYLVLY